MKTYQQNRDKLETEYWNIDDHKPSKLKRTSNAGNETTKSTERYVFDHPEGIQMRRRVLKGARHPCGIAYAIVVHKLCL